jgi:itaconate CoA-transferase
MTNLPLEGTIGNGADSALKTIEALLPPAVFAGVEPCMDPLRAVGQHSEPILRSLGRTEEKIEHLARSVV